MTFNRGRVAAVTVALVAASVPAAKAAEVAPPFEIRPAAIKVSWDKLTAKTRVAINSSSGRDLVLGFAFSPLKNGDVLLCSGCVNARLIPPATSTVTGVDARRTLPAGASAEVQLSAMVEKMAKNKSAKSPAEGRYSGSLVVYVDGADAAVRVPLVVVVGTLGMLEAEPLVETVTATIHCRWPLDDSCEQGQTVEIPLKDGVDAGADGANLALDKQDVVGSVAGDAGSGIVRYVGATEASTGTDAVKVNVEKLSRADDYEGKVDLQPNDDEAGVVTVKATVSDSWGWPLLMLALGIGVGLYVMRRGGSGRAIFNLRTRRGEALTDVDDAQSEYDKAAAAGTDWTGITVLAAARSVGETIKTKLDELGRSSFSAPDETKVKEIETLLGTLKTAAEELRALIKELPKLSSAAAKLDEREPGLGDLVPPQTVPPPLAAAARALLAGGTLSFAELTTRLKDVKAMTELAEEWKKHEKLVSGYKQELDEIDVDRLPVADKTLHAKQLRDLGAVSETMWDVGDADEFESQYIDRDLAEIHRQVSFLKAAPRIDLSEALEHIRISTFRFGRGIDRDLLDMILAGRGGEVPRPTTPPLPAPTPTNREQLTSRRIRRRVDHWLCRPLHGQGVGELARLPDGFPLGRGDEDHARPAAGAVARPAGPSASVRAALSPRLGAGPPQQVPGREARVGLRELFDSAEDVTFEFEVPNGVDRDPPTLAAEEGPLRRLPAGGSEEYPLISYLGMSSQWAIVFRWKEGDDEFETRQSVR